MRKRKHQRDEFPVCSKKHSFYPKYSNPSMLGAMYLAIMLRLTTFILLVRLSAFAQSDTLYHAEGTASYYAAKFHGRRTASGEVFHKDSLTAAHKFLPFGTRIRVTNLANGKAVYVKINDRGMKGLKRIVDLSPAAARELDMISRGVARVKVEEIPPGIPEGTGLQLPLPADTSGR